MVVVDCVIIAFIRCKDSLCLLNYVQLYSWFILNNYYVIMVYLVKPLYIFLNILYIVLVTCFHTILFPCLCC